MAARGREAGRRARRPAASRDRPDVRCEQRLLFDVLLRAGRHWSWTQRPEGIERGRFVVVMSCDAAAVPSLRGRLRGCLEGLS
ncbi:hypothetical protein ACQKM2_01415 [Streptomyces sp. NPDC004126]|uniref:hypothetical protein n=1 Tax=Streptomyces sp. NPDC004126 TaxID=3390695 RepID=UPI003D0955CC